MGSRGAASRWLKLMQKRHCDRHRGWTVCAVSCPWLVAQVWALGQPFVVGWRESPGGPRAPAWERPSSLGSS